MKLTGGILLQKLQGTKQIIETAGIEKCRALKGLLLYHSQEKPQPGWVYVVDAARPVTVGSVTDDNILFLLAGEADIPFQAHGGWIRMTGSVSLETTLNLVSQAFSGYERWKEELEQIQYRSGSVEEMLWASVPVFQNPLVMLDFGMNVVSWASEGISLKESPGFFSDGPERTKIVDAVMNHPSYRQNRILSTCYWGPEDQLGFKCICRNITAGDGAGYTLAVVEDSRTLVQADMDLLEILGFHIGFILQLRGSREVVRFENPGRVLEQILTDRTKDYTEASRQLAGLGWGERHTYFCLVFQLTYLDRSVLPASSICRYMEQMYACCSFLHGEEIVTFFNLDLSPLSLEDIQNKLRPFIRDNYLKAGFSRCVEGHMHLRHQYVQATIALDAGSRHSPYQWIHYFDQVAFVYLQEQMTRQLPGEMLVHEGILRLRENDRKQGTEYIKTLRVYLNSSRNAVHSAKELYIHRSTFLYRLDKIRQILDSDLSDPDEVQYLSLSLRLMELGGNEG